MSDRELLLYALGEMKHFCVLDRAVRKIEAALAAQQSAEHIDPVVYRIIIRHWHDGQLDVSFEGVGDEPDDLKAIAFALHRLADDFERGNRGSKEQ